MPAAAGLSAHERSRLFTGVIATLPRAARLFKAPREGRYACHARMRHAAGMVPPAYSAAAALPPPLAVWRAVILLIYAQRAMPRQRATHARCYALCHSM